MQGMIGRAILRVKGEMLLDKSSGVLRGGGLRVYGMGVYTLARRVHGYIGGG